MGLLHHDYVWHDAAQGWQTPELGEQMMKGLVDLDLDSFIVAFGALGISESVARAMKPHINDVMADSVVRLYRDAAQPVMRHLGEKFVSQKPKRGLVIIAENDQYAGPHETHEQLASAVGAKVARLDGCGHWWMMEKPQEAARMLASHWIR
jgi:pimeloyl-ACP methyl ester carboxylesterase